MANSPRRPGAKEPRDPAKHSKKDPARPTRAKAARPETPTIDPALADLLNPAIGQGRAGVGSQTGTPSPPVGEGGVGGREVTRDGGGRARPHLSPPAQSLPTSTPNPSPTSLRPGARKRDPDGGGEGQAVPAQQTSGLAPAPDNSFDRRADFANAHRARASVARGFGEAPQQGYVGKTPGPLGELDPDLVRALGIDEPAGESEDPRNVITPDMGPARLRLQRAGHGEVGTVAGLASQQSLDRLLREGRPELERASLGAAPTAAAGQERGRTRASSSNPISTRRATSRRRSTNWSRACNATIAPRCCSASPAPARPSPWRR